MVWVALVFALAALLVAVVAVAGVHADYARTSERMDNLEAKRNEHVLTFDHLWLERQANTAVLGCDHQRARLDALAAALGYEWVPEGKTKAEWRRKNPFRDCSIRFGGIGDTGPDPHLADKLFGKYVPPPARSRRKGDRKKGGRK